MSGVFTRVLVPVEFATVPKGATTDGEIVQVNAEDATAIGPFTIDALELAAKLAAGGEVWLVHAHHDFSEYAMVISPDAVDALDTGVTRYATKVLKAAAERHCPGVEARFVVEPGAALEVILRVAAREGVEAIALAASSRGRWNRAFHGSTADKLIRRAPCPVVVVPSGAS